jgi:hypothetical protein
MDMKPSGPVVCEVLNYIFNFFNQHRAIQFWFAFVLFQLLVTLSTFLCLVAISISSFVKRLLSVFLIILCMD